MNEPELFSGMSFEQIQEYADWRLSVPSQTTMDVEIKPIYILIANLTAKMKGTGQDAAEQLRAELIIDMAYLKKANELIERYKAENKRLKHENDRLESTEFVQFAHGTVTKIEQLQAENKRLKEALEHIIEYWNKDRNDSAMHDALWHIIEEAEKALKGEK